MVTPDFEEWLERQDIPIEETETIEDYIAYLKEELGITGGSLDVARSIWYERYEYMPQLGIRPIDYTGVIRGIEYKETRYGIAGYPGLWGRERMLEIATGKAEERGLWEIADYLRLMRHELE